MKDQIYEWLGREFKRIEEKLDAEGKTELDGLLWKLAGTLEEAGMWKSLEIALGLDEKSPLQSSKEK